MVRPAILAFLLSCGGSPPTPQAPTPAPPIIDLDTVISVALTFDDLPYQTGPGGTPTVTVAMEQVQISQRIIAALKRHKAPATVFINCHHLPGPQKLPEMWLDAGFELGNHTATHRNANTGTLDEWASDVQACERQLKALWTPDHRWFRYPYLQRGWTKARHDAVAARLEQMGLEDVPVSVPTSEWLLAEYYDRALQQGKQQLASEIAVAYIDHVVRGIQEASQLAILRRKQDIPHIALLHINRLNADHLDRLLTALDNAGIVLIPTLRAMQDPVYNAPSQYYGKGALSWILRIPPPTQQEVPDWFGEQSWTLSRTFEPRLKERE